MNQVNINQMNQKRMRDDMSERIMKEEQGLAPAHLGNGYRQQLAFMQEAERLNNVSLKHYQNMVASQAANKSMQ